METLEFEKHALEVQNQMAIEENRKLLDHLESLNTAVADSDTNVRDLTETLQTTEQELTRLQGLMSHTERLQRQVELLEEEQEKLHNQLGKSKDDERSNLLQFQQAHRTVLSLHTQIEDIEREAHEERQRHSELLELIRKKRALQPDQASASSKLHEPPRQATNTTVVSHVLRDVLADNANMQLGMQELRELLQRSNEEVESLREQVLESSPDMVSTAAPFRSPDPDSSAEVGSSEVHVHHHYHMPSPGAGPVLKIPRSQVRRVPKRRRAQAPYSLNSISHTARSSVSSIIGIQSPISEGGQLPISAVMNYRPRVSAQRWSMQSGQTGFTSTSSLPTSPSAESTFDRVFGSTNTDFSRPTSPESGGIISPRRSSVDQNVDSCDGLKHETQQSGPSIANGFATGSNSKDGVSVEDGLGIHGLKRAPPVPPFMPPLPAAQTIIMEEKEEQASTPSPCSIVKENQTNNTQHSSPDPFTDTPRFSYRDRRASVTSISGMDIHTLSIKPSDLLLGERIRNFSPTAKAISTRSITSTRLSNTSVTAVVPQTYGSSNVNHKARTSQSYLSNLAVGDLSRKPSKGILPTKGIGGWVLSKWGTAARETDSTTSPRSTTSTPTRAVSVGSITPITIAPARLADAQPAPVNSVPSWNMQFKLRSPGVNQSGPIFGFRPEPPTPYNTKVTEADVNIRALREVLEES